MSILNDIVEVKRAEVAALRRKYSRSSFTDFPAFYDPVRNFTASLQAVDRTSPAAIIAEIKRASPSAGNLRELTDPGALAREYEVHGAAAVSVLTDERFFGGSGRDLTTVRKSVALPLLRKDFVIDEFQILESRSLGADAVLLIAAILETSAIGDLRALAGELGMDVLVEVHEAAELQKIEFNNPPLVGINNRNLGDMTVDPRTTLRIAKLLPAGVPFVSESGLRSAADVRAALEAGATAVLMGEYFMKSEHPGMALKEILDELR